MELKVRAVPASVSRCRHWAAFMAQQLGAHAAAVRVVELLTSELVTNAIKFGTAGAMLVVSARRLGDAVVVSVRDESSGEPAVRPAGPDDMGGRGLLLVETLAAQWGVEPHSTGGKSVWFSIGVGAQVASA